MAEARLFQNNRSQAVRLPKAVAWPAHVKSVEVIKLGNARLLAPAGTLWDSFFAGGAVSEDFMQDREQPPAQERDAIRD